MTVRGMHLIQARGVQEGDRCCFPSRVRCGCISTVHLFDRTLPISLANDKPCVLFELVLSSYLFLPHSFFTRSSLWLFLNSKRKIVFFTRLVEKVKERESLKRRRRRLNSVPRYSGYFLSLFTLTPSAGPPLLTFLYFF